MRKICIINQKGGVGKTTTTINLGAGLSRNDRKVLIIDLDAQGNINSSLNIESYKDIYEFLFENAELNECICHVGKNLDIIRSKETLTKSEFFLSKESEKEFLLKNKLKDLSGYDYVLVDCPPSLGLLNQNAMIFADEAIIPASTDYLGLDALRKMSKAIREINKHFDHSLKISKVIPTMFDKRHKLAHEIMKEMQNEFYELMSDPIGINSKLKECPSAKMSIFTYDKNSNGAKDYERLVKSVLRDEHKYMKHAPVVQAAPEAPVKHTAVSHTAPAHHKASAPVHHKATPAHSKAALVHHKASAPVHHKVVAPVHHKASTPAHHKITSSKHSAKKPVHKKK